MFFYCFILFTQPLLVQNSFAIFSCFFPSHIMSTISVNLLIKYIILYFTQTFTVTTHLYMTKWFMWSWINVIVESKQKYCLTSDKVKNVYINIIKTCTIIILTIIRRNNLFNHHINVILAITMFLKQKIAISISPFSEFFAHL